MEVVGSVAAVLQLVQAVGKTVVQVSRVYQDIRDMDDTLRDFDSQLDATRMVLSVLEERISGCNSASLMPAWWDQTTLKRLLYSCHRSYGRLQGIFIKINRQRSSAVALRAYIRKCRYDSDIGHLRLCINTYTSALQLPVMIQATQRDSTAVPPQTPTGHATASLDDLMDRIYSLELSMDRLQHNLATRALQRADATVPVAPQLRGIEDMIKELKLEMSTVAATQGARASEASARQAEEQLAQLQAAMSELRSDFKQFSQQGMPQDNRFELDATEQKEKLDMEKDTRATLDMLKGVMHQTRDYASSIESASISSRSRKPKATQPTRAPGSPSVNNLPGKRLDLETPFSPRKLQSVAEWAENVHEGDAASLVSMSSASISIVTPSITTNTSATQSTASVSTGVPSLFEELHERRIQAAERFMKEKAFHKAIPHLERLLASKNDASCPQEAQLSMLAKALVHTRAEEKKIDLYCQQFPAVRAKVDKFRLEHALQLLQQGRCEEVVCLLQQYITEPSGAESTPRSTPAPEISQKILMTFCRALIQSTQNPTKNQVIPIMKQLLDQGSLDPADQGDAHWLLTKAYCLGSDYESAKTHCFLACQLKIDTLGRDDEQTLACITLMVEICARTGDPDEDLWIDMLPADGLEQAVLGHVQEAIVRCCQEMQRLAALDEAKAVEFGISFLRENYQVIQGHGRSHPRPKGERIPLSEYFLPEGPLLCWDCLGQHMSRCYTLAAFQAGSACAKHKTGPYSQEAMGISPFHFFSIAVPRPGKWWYRRPDHCVPEMNALLGMTGASQCDQAAMINATMQYSARRGQEQNYSRLSALWLAAIHENRHTVDFLLSLNETDVAQGSDLLQHATYNFGPEVSMTAHDRYIRSRLGHSQTRSIPFLKAFIALKEADAQRIMTSPRIGRWSWWLLHPHMLDDFLGTCGKGRGNMLIESKPYGTCSLLQYLIHCFGATSPLAPSHEARDHILSVIRILSRHGVVCPDTAFMTGYLGSDMRNASGSEQVDRSGDRAARALFWLDILRELVQLGANLSPGCWRLLEAEAPRATAGSISKACRGPPPE